jgi:Fic family protein
MIFGRPALFYKPAHRSMPYLPPFTITPRLIDLVSRISEALGRWAAAEVEMTPWLRRENRIRTIHASLAIENNTLSLEQVSDIIEGMRVLGHPREILEVHNALAAYELMDSLEAHSAADFLRAHAALMKDLAEDAGRFWLGGVGVFQGERVVHMAPPAERVPRLLIDLRAAAVCREIRGFSDRGPLRPPASRSHRRTS